MILRASSQYLPQALRSARRFQFPMHFRCLSSSNQENKDFSPLQFDDIRESYRGKSVWELIRASVLFEACCIPFFVNNCRKLVALSDKILSKPVTTWLVKHTLMKQFCAGETGSEVRQTIMSLRKNGIESILDWAVENEANIAVKSTDAHSESKDIHSTDHYLDENCETSIHTIEDVHKLNPASGFSAIKLSGLACPADLIRVSNVLNENYELFVKLAREVVPPPSSFRPLHQIPVDEMAASVKVLRMRLFVDDLIQSLKLDSESADLLRQAFASYDRNDVGSLGYLDWFDLICPVQKLMREREASDRHADAITVERAEFDKRLTFLPRLTGEEEGHLRKVLTRCLRIADAAENCHVRMMYDAEQTFVQPAIDAIVMMLQRRFNRDFPHIYHTYQAYLVSTQDRIIIDMERARKENYWISFKLVRGAYMRHERELAKAQKRPSPILENKQLTDEQYDRIALLILHRLRYKCDAMLATHNSDSVQRAVTHMHDMGLPTASTFNKDTGHGALFFGQLLGMRDNVSYELGRRGYAAFKWVPFGPTRGVLAYLLRRIEENGDALANAKTERNLALKALRYKFLRF